MASIMDEKFPVEDRFIEQLERLECKVESLLKLVNRLLALVQSSNIVDMEELLRIGTDYTKSK